MHNIRYWVLDEKCDRKKVFEDIKRVAENDGDGYNGGLRWHDAISPLQNEKAAEEWIRLHDNGWYDDHAMRFFDYSDAKETKKMAGLKERGAELTNRLVEFEKAHSVRQFKAEYIGCQNCGSKVAKKYLRSDRCPVCGTDLRSDSVLGKIKEYNDKIAKAREDYRAEEEKQKSRAKVKWLVKFEFHS